MSVFDGALIRTALRRRLALLDDAYEVRMHPFDYEDVALAPDHPWGVHRSGDWLAAGEARWRGITVRSDPDVEQGKPELRWREVLHG